MPNLARVEIEQDETGWVLRVTNPGSRAQEYRCASKEQAQKLADVMTGAKPASNQAASRPGPSAAAPPPPAAKPPTNKR